MKAKVISLIVITAVLAGPLGLERAAWAQQGQLQEQAQGVEKEAALPPKQAAPESRWYVGASVGSVDAYEVFWGNLLATIVQPVATVYGVKRTLHELDTVDTGYTLLAGYRVSEKLALEGTYYDLGEYKITDTWEYTYIPGYSVTTTYTEEARALGLSAVLGRRWFLRLGGIYWRTDITIRMAGLGKDEKYNRTGTDFVAGAGVQFNVVKNWKLRLEIEHFSNVNETNRLMFAAGITAEI